MVLIKETMKKAREVRFILFGEVERKGNSDWSCLYAIMFPDPLDRDMRWF